MKALFDVLVPGSRDYGLASAIDPDRLPAHNAITMNGNGRWAKGRFGGLGDATSLGAHLNLR